MYCQRIIAVENMKRRRYIHTEETRLSKWSAVWYRTVSQLLASSVSRSTNDGSLCGVCVGVCELCRHDISRSLSRMFPIRSSNKTKYAHARVCWNTRPIDTFRCSSRRARNAQLHERAAIRIFRSVFHASSPASSNLLKPNTCLTDSTQLNWTV